MIHFIGSCLVNTLNRKNSMEFNVWLEPISLHPLPKLANRSLVKTLILEFTKTAKKFSNFLQQIFLKLLQKSHE